MRDKTRAHVTRTRSRVCNERLKQISLTALDPVRREKTFFQKKALKFQRDHSGSSHKTETMLAI